MIPKSCSCKNTLVIRSSPLIKFHPKPARRFCSTATQANHKEWRSLFEGAVRSLNDWYEVAPQNVDETASKILKTEFGGSLYTALTSLFPEVEWYAWKFKHQNVPKGYWTNISNQRKFFNELGKKIGIQTLDDWYSKINIDLLRQNNGASILQKYHGSPMDALISAYPEHNWVTWKFPNVSRGTWQTAEKRRQYFDWLGQQVGVKQLDDWYPLISAKLLIDNNGGTLLELYHSPVKILMETYPEHKWFPWKFTYTPNKFWNSIDNQRQFFDWLGNELGIKHLDDWYSALTFKLVEQQGGSALLKRHNMSPFEALKTVYPEHNWVPWKFNVANHGFWKSVSNQRQFMDWLGKELGVKELDDWYPLIDTRIILAHGGSRMLAMYHASIIDIMKTVYPEHNWIPWLFKSIPSGFWKSPENQRKFFDWLGEKLGVKQLDDWYTVLSSKNVRDNGGASIVLMHGTVVDALLNAYPDHNWVPWKFSIAARGYWGSSDNLSQFVSDLSEKLSIQTLEDWYRVDFMQLYHVGASKVLNKYKGLYNILKQQYPDYPWDPKKFQKGRKGQRWLVVTLKKMFPNEEIIEDYMHPKAFSPSTHRPLQLDVFIPSKSLAFEYQGIQHYQDVGIFSPSNIYKRRDEEKRSICASNSIKLIEVPYWWNRSQKELQHIMHHSSV